MSGQLTRSGAVAAVADRSEPNGTGTISTDPMIKRMPAATSVAERTGAITRMSTSFGLPREHATAKHQHHRETSCRGRVAGPSANVDHLARRAMVEAKGA